MTGLTKIKINLYEKIHAWLSFYQYALHQGDKCDYLKERYCHLNKDSYSLKRVRNICLKRDLFAYAQDCSICSLAVRFARDVSREGLKSV